MTALIGTWLFAPGLWDVLEVPGFPGIVRAAGAGPDAGLRSAVYLLDQCLNPRRDGRHEIPIVALRHLADPSLAPLFSAMSESTLPELRLHGILGLAEVRGGLELDQVAPIDDLKVLTELISSAMDDDLLGDDAAAQLLTWTDLDIAVKLLIATRMVRAGRFGQVSVLHKAMESPRLSRKGLAALLLHQLGESAGFEGLGALDTSNHSRRDVIRAMLLQTALRHRFDRARDWAFSVSTESGVDPKLALLAMRTAMRFGDPRAIDQWQQRLGSNPDAAAQRRLALTGLRLSPWLEPARFDGLVSHEDPLIRRMGLTARAIASEDRDVPEQIDVLVRMDQRDVNNWVLDHATDHASPDDARIILVGLVMAHERWPGHAARAAQILVESHSADAADLLGPIVAGAGGDPRLAEVIMLGLLNSRSTPPDRLVANLGPFDSLTCDHLALLLKTRTGQPLDPNQVRDLRLLVRGGGNLDTGLRIQAAWSYLKQTGQTEAALAQVVGGGP